MLGSYIVVKNRIRVPGTNNANRRKKKLTIKNNAPFRPCITKINNTFKDNAEDIDMVILMYNLLELVTIILLHQEVCGIIVEMK